VQFGDHGARLWPRPAKLGFGQISAQADFLVVPHQASEWSTFFEKHKGDVLIVGGTIGEIADRFRDVDGGLFHKIRLSADRSLDPKPGL
jgi:hypothetical protein